MTLGTRIVVMKDGVVQQVDTPQNLYTKPCNLFVAGFIGSPQMNFLDAEVKVNGSDVTLSVGGHELPVPADKKQALIDKGYAGKTVILGIRPEDVHVVIYCHMWIKSVVLEYHSDISVFWLYIIHYFSVNLQCTAGNILKTCDHTKCC